MKKLHEMRFLIYSVGLLFSSAFERIITSVINEYYNLFEENAILYHTLSMILLIVLFVTTNILIKYLINTKFISKIVFGRKYVGGHWIEIVYREKGNEEKKSIEASHYCDLEIGYDIDKIFLSGTDYNEKYEFMYNLETESASMENYGLSYIYRCEGGNVPHRVGHGTLYFHKKDLSRPDRYSGRFKGEDGTSFIVEGFLIDKPSDIKGLNRNFITTFDRLIREKKNEIIETREIAAKLNQEGEE